VHEQRRHLTLKFHGFNRVGFGAAEVREKASKKGSCACYCKWCKVMVADTYRGRRVTAGWRGRKISRGCSRREDLYRLWRGEDHIAKTARHEGHFRSILLSLIKYKVLWHMAGHMMRHVNV